MGSPQPMTELGELREHGGDLRDLHFAFEGVGAIVQADADDLRRARQRCVQFGVGGLDHLGPGRIVEPALDAVEGIGAPGDDG